jgi:hypothetical protein
VTGAALALVLATAPLTETEGVSIRDDSYHPRPLMLSFFGAVMPQYVFGDQVYPFGYGGALRFGVSLFDNGFIRRVNDSFWLELGGNFFYGPTPGCVGGPCGYFLATPVIGVRWTFHFSPRFSAYAKLDAGWNFIVSAIHAWTPYFSASAGALVALTRHFYLRAEIGYPGFLLGVGIAF